jgi:hypothetical protein
MRHSTIEDLVLANRALLAEAEEAGARQREVQFHNLLVTVKCLMSSAYDPAWVSALTRSKGAARYRRIADAAWARGLSHWRQGSQALITASKVTRAELADGLQSHAHSTGGDRRGRG